MQSNNPTFPQKAFTLIELLIVVAIIAILAAIAVPNFMEAQIRSKVSRGKGDMRSLATAMEAYYVDTNSYPPCNSFAVCMNSVKAPGVSGYSTDDHEVLERLSTPIAYITTSIYPDPFYAELSTRSVYGGKTGDQQGLSKLTGYGACARVPAYHTYLYTSTGSTNRSSPYYGNLKARAYVLASAGPDLIYINQGGIIANNSGGPYTGSSEGSTLNGKTVAEKQAYCANLQYDTTNGTKSFGDIYRAGGDINNLYGQYFYQAIPR
ncbi:TPA: hypothetical protein DDW35_02650 [Candidatus Sumerlaeota bacterium]|jgi:prepilin-type N-terminal cleavage/methylation domain-containing protein|nr:hypothetical protein [Candidatus Sumerlaeota bacterium]